MSSDAEIVGRGQRWEALPASDGWSRDEEAVVVLDDEDDVRLEFYR
ncbi:MAG: hypothetical protein ACRDZ4_20120 [Egibacteraceae bacterium]